ncbi:hypothetical protein [Deinococcus sp. S9]|uniref:hypothetical protein n=1 Tax=Deinococcus sp. S9 TaxID=2545754 RepID=UPI0010544920|nr:hypothetical protein [Deinococcus sp. S9]TDE85442.1 hypothetical protein E0686_11810 [Deinococcus sp. S9]
MPVSFEFISLTRGGITLSGFVSGADLNRIESGQECLVVMHDVTRDGAPLGRLVGLFRGGELTTQVPVWGAVRA